MSSELRRSVTRVVKDRLDADAETAQVAAGVIAFQGVAAALAGKNGPPDCRIEPSWRVPSRESLEK